MEAKYAVVLPRMNKLGKAKAAEAPPAAPGSSGPTAPTSEPKPPKPGAKLVLPVKPDLSLLRSMRKPLLGGPPSAVEVLERSSGPHGASEGSSAPTEHQEGFSVLQAARGKLKPSHLNLCKTPGSGPRRPQGPDPGGEGPAAGPKPSSQAIPHGEPSAAPSGVRSLYEEEADREVAQLMGEGGVYAAQPGVHWTGNPRMSGDPQVCDASSDE